MRPPYLLLDVDGVLIPFPASNGTGPETHTCHDVVPTGRTADNPVAIWLNSAHGPLLMHVIRTGLLTPVWCTSWRQNAATLIGPLLNLPPLPHIDLPHPQIATSHPNGYLWKRDHVDDWLGDAPAIWIDDDFTSLDHEWARERTARGPITALVQPDPHVGLLAEHLVEVLAWGARLAIAGGDTPRVVGGAEAAKRNRLRADVSTVHGPRATFCLRPHGQRGGDPPRCRHGPRHAGPRPVRSSRCRAAALTSGVR